MKLSSVFACVFWTAGASLVAAESRRDATLPVVQSREVYGDVTWPARHEAILARHRTVRPEVVFLGDSITHFWAGEPKAHRVTDPASWARVAGGRAATNLGFGFDYIENAHWRVANGELDGISPRLVVILLGTNNLGHKGDTPAECVRGMNALLATIRAKQPRAKILLVGILPRGAEHAQVVAATNAGYAKLADRSVTFVQVGEALGDKHPAGLTAKKEYFRDGLHPNAAGYAKYAESLSPHIERLLAK